MISKTKNKNIFLKVDDFIGKGLNKIFWTLSTPIRSLGKIVNNNNKYLPK